MRRFSFIGAMLVLAALLATGPAVAEPLKVRVGWAVVPGQLTAILFLKPDILKHYGTSYTVETVKFRGSAPQITALAAGELDLAALAFSSVGLAIQNAHMDDIRVVADLYQDGIEGYYTSEYMVLADGPIKTIEDLKDKVLASNGIGGAIDMAMRKILLDHGLKEKRDYRIVEVEFPNMTAALKQKKVDLAGEVTPFSIIAHKDGALRTLFTLKGAMGPGADHAAGGARGVHQRASRPARGFLRGLDPRHPLVSRPEEPRRGRGHPRRLHQIAEIGVR